MTEPIYSLVHINKKNKIILKSDITNEEFISDGFFVDSLDGISNVKNSKGFFVTNDHKKYLIHNDLSVVEID